MMIQRDLDHKIVAGVCAGLAEHMQWNLHLVRLGCIFLAYIFPIGIGALYVLAAYYLPEKECKEAEEKKFSETIEFETVLDQKYTPSRLTHIKSRLKKLEQERYRLEKKLLQIGAHLLDERIERIEQRLKQIETTRHQLLKELKQAEHQLSGN